MSDHKPGCTGGSTQTKRNGMGIEWSTCKVCKGYWRTGAKSRQIKPDTTEAPMTVADINALAADLVRVLADHAGHPEQVGQILSYWLDTHDTARLGLIAMAAMSLTYGKCLTPRPLAEIPPGSVTYSDQEAAHANH
ncbi:MAG: hypothetical protein ABI903_16500 [Actinomycetota bacterium]